MGVGTIRAWFHRVLDPLVLRKGKKLNDDCVHWNEAKDIKKAFRKCCDGHHSKP